MTNHEQLLELHKSGGWVCSTDIEFMRDHRKRYSELAHKGYVFDSKPCDMHNHSSRLFMRRLTRTPERKEVFKQSFLDSKERERAYQKLEI